MHASDSDLQTQTSIDYLTHEGSSVDTYRGSHGTVSSADHIIFEQNSANDKRTKAGESQFTTEKVAALQPTLNRRLTANALQGRDPETENINSDNTLPDALSDQPVQPSGQDQPGYVQASFVPQARSGAMASNIPFIQTLPDYRFAYISAKDTSLMITEYGFPNRIEQSWPMMAEYNFPIIDGQAWPIMAEYNSPIMDG